MTNSPWEPARLSLREPIDVLAAVPYLIGYQPTDSVVVLAMRGRRLFFTVRDDLPPPGGVPEAVDELLDMVLRQDVSGVLLVAFGTDERSRSVLFGLRDAFHDTGLAVLEILRAHEGRYWSYVCGDLDCCPLDGTPYDIHASAVPAEATVAGCVAMPDRESFESLIEPDIRPELERATMRAGERMLAQVASRGRRSLAATGRTALDAALERQRGGQRLDDEDVAWLSVLLESTSVRDLALARIGGAYDAVELHRALWMDVFRRALPQLAVAPGSLFAFAAWRCGDATLARLALDRVLEVDPDYALARLMHRILVAGVPPSALDELPEPPVRRRRVRRRRKRSSSRRAGNR
jgi:hypothetical protein